VKSIDSNASVEEPVQCVGKQKPTHLTHCVVEKTRTEKDLKPWYYASATKCDLLIVFQVIWP
jgi:hypothetical protein